MTVYYPQMQITSADNISMLGPITSADSFGIVGQDHPNHGFHTNHIDNNFFPIMI
jgi:hypothetical protein